MSKTKMTADEYYAVADLDPCRSELIDGEYVVTPEPLPLHAFLQIRLGGAVDRWAHEGRHPFLVGGPTDVELDPHNVFGPDLVVTRATPGAYERGMVGSLPLLVVEIRSPSTWHRDTGRKRSMYEASGVPELWLVDGFTSTVRVLDRSSPDSATYDQSRELTRDDTLTSPQLPGFALALADLFREQAG